MVNNSMGNSKEEAGCNWVRARLPLWVGDRDSRTVRNGEGGDLSLVEHHRIERHLEHCSACRRYCSALERALDTLAAVATDSPVQPQATSLWPALKHRIEDLNRARPTRWSSVIYALTDRLARALPSFIPDRPVRRAWARDRLRARSTTDGNGWLGSHRRVGLVLGLSLIAFLLIVAIAVPASWRAWATAQSTITANALPLASRGVPSAGAASELRPDSSRPDGSEPQDELVQAEVAHLGESPGGGASSPAEPKPTAPARFGYDLEHGIPMPPDARESKPVY
jgi:hypothetical protein